MAPPDPTADIDTRIVLAEIKQSMQYMSRDINDLKVNQAKQIDRLGEKLSVIEAWRERTDASVKILSRAQSVLYVVFTAGFVLGAYVVVHHP